jgi:hypothetical protein
VAGPVSQFTTETLLSHPQFFFSLCGRPTALNTETLYPYVPKYAVMAITDFV